MSYDGPDRIAFNQRVATDKDRADTIISNSENWLGAVIADFQEETSNAGQRRARLAFAARAERRYGSFVRQAQDAEELEAHIGVIEDGLRETANEVAKEYGGTDPEALYTEARTSAREFFSVENWEGDSYQHKQIDIDTEMNDSVPGARGESFKGQTVQEALDAGGKSRNHPREMRDPIIPDPDAYQVENDTTEIKRKVETIDADKPIGEEQKGVTDSWSNDVGSAVTSATKWHVFE